MITPLLLAAAASCGRFHGISSWSGSIHVTYSREAHTPYYIERLAGRASYVNRLRPSMLPVSFNGYSWTWEGHAQGTESFTDEVVNADGSPLSRPDRTTGEGAILADPPLGEFGPEQFWSNPEKCVYAFYTSAAVNAVHTYESGSVQGIDVHVEGIPFPHRVSRSPDRGRTRFRIAIITAAINFTCRAG